MDEQVVPWRIPNWFPDLTEIEKSRLRILSDELHRFSRRADIVARKTLPLADLIHFANSILGGRLVMEQAKPQHVFDIGTTGGFPGLVMAILWPKLRVTIVEEDPRKLEYFLHASKVLELTNVDFIEKNPAQLPEASISVGIARGPAPISKTLLLARKLVPTGGTLFHFKGEEWATEVSQIPTQLCTYWKPSLLGSYPLPVGEVTFSVVRTLKARD